MAKKFYKKNAKRGLKPTIFPMKNRKNSKGLSTIVITLIIILVSIVAVGIVWAFVNNMIKNQIRDSESCYGNYDKIKINGMYTCFERISAANYNLRFSLSMGDISVDKVIVSVSSAGNVNSYQITNTAQNIINLVMYSGTNPANVILPAKNAGLTYNATGFSAKIDSIEIAPYIQGTLCGVSDSVSEIEDCKLIF